MNKYKADLHNHTVLSPCGDIEMTPNFILGKARELGYDIVGITDHNTTLQAREIKKIAGDSSPYILCGAEITTKEEAHCLAFVDGDENLNKLQAYLEEHLPAIPNNVDYFGYQLLVNEKEEIIKEEEFLLISAINQTVTQIEAFVHALDGIFIPAHIDKKRDSLISQLGFIPPGLEIEAIEFSRGCDIEEFLKLNKYLSSKTKIRSSDAHYCEDFLSCTTIFHMESISFEEIKMALRGENNRYVTIKD